MQVAAKPATDIEAKGTFASVWVTEGEALKGPTSNVTDGYNGGTVD